jgi:hypothetical protein
MSSASSRAPALQTVPGTTLRNTQSGKLSPLTIIAVCRADVRARPTPFDRMLTCISRVHEYSQRRSQLDRSAPQLASMLGWEPGRSPFRESLQQSSGSALATSQEFDGAISVHAVGSTTICDVFLIPG